MCRKKQAQPITPEMEIILWEKQVFSRNTSKGLRNVVFWYASKMFGLRAADENRHLDADQFSIESEENGDRFLRFMGRSCKNYQGGLRHRKVEPKDFRIYEDKTRGERCIVSCFEFYLTLIPATGPFYRRPIGDSPPRYSTQAIGLNTLKTIAKNFCTEAGFSSQYSNHSGKETCATELFRNDVDEQLIMKQTGHQSQDAVRAYKRPSIEHTKRLSDYLQPPHPKRSQPSTNILNQHTSNVVVNSTSSPTLPVKIRSAGNSTQNIYIYINNK